MADPVQPKNEQSPEPRPARPPGEVGGHTVQPSEQPSVGGGLQGATSRETPAPRTPEEGPKAGAAAKTVSAPEKPANQTAGQPQAPVAPVGAKPVAKDAVKPAVKPAADVAPKQAEKDVPPQETKPAAPAALEKPSLRMREPDGLGAKKEEVVEHLVASLAEMLARALRQSVEQAVEDVLGGKAAQAPGQAAAAGIRQAEVEKPKTAPT
ncbi:MAG: hypothetical protein LC620_03770 [Halobacteriales archaeon]|nr:hypothetical protein [Halobacteriales archaeon]